MHIVITGGAGFLGARLARTLLAQGSLALAGAAAQPIERITLVDRAPPPPDLTTDPRIAAVVGDLNAQLADAGAAYWAGADAVFHLAAAVSGECEADFDLGMRSNFGATNALLERLRAAGTAPVLVFSSSLAVFGNSPEQPLPEVIDDDTLPTPQTSYGIQKFIGEQLVADYTRKGFIRGRSVRLMTVSVRPGRPNGAASGFFSGMIREPLAGIRAACPVPDETPVALASPARTIEGIVRAAEASDAQWGPRTALNLPSLGLTVGDMAAALERVAGPAATALLDRTPDPAIQRIVKTWPGRIEARRARGLGLLPDASFEDVIRDYVRENPDAVKLPTNA
ncbi:MULTISPECIES: D-erythronate dehydrogenase [unclassified Variovorax]|uniref:D-erythronate dehydrogenase n=1 Tax=unclassified Variovorax TaxID=663243 RepID=UPI00076DCF61|nr:MULTISPECIES: D-erythronate dehydrogenase [unclassified Variovorax]KWT74100.1 NAD-dependent epimerase/dehydratase [Variovorax sp. WDL1]PNG52208.1 putative epimerase/dehydratase [Variovorax sp. B4]PNG54748.1 putative epimerase/dehydratase [Variovorax sp. B2]VTV15743.1 putative epimerase/dehydratase [Variovorax sp. WDL1]